ncbi:hypothetical protein DSO57_1031095 [Entomophthora muscae]|uniref:Uncharacterized protein n=1 Tax=Entomophthora muscae TaxID=34485 RepID=A0ACC2ULQ0_9FUNG|nr:hypothetical protein DSO57_1031095 [Entomophthora muscae]
MQGGSCGSFGDWLLPRALNAVFEKAQGVVGCTNHLDEGYGVEPTDGVPNVEEQHIIQAKTVKFCGPPLALNQDVFLRPSKKVTCVQAKPLQNLEDLAHTVDEHFVLAFLAEVPILPLESPSTAEEMLIQLDCLLSWCCPVLRHLADQQENVGCMEQGGYVDIGAYLPIVLVHQPCLLEQTFLISQTPGLLSNAIRHLNQVPNNLASYGLFPWSASYLEGLSPPPESRITETYFSNLADPLPTAVSSPSLPSVHQIPVLDPDVPPTRDHSLWLLTGALVMALDAYFPPLSQPVSFGRPL